ncbi:unnamed protein product [Closterium sp. Yama58-4]|nr:unnamed protein product [Closterium sp. Yama58-4]
MLDRSDLVTSWRDMFGVLVAWRQVSDAMEPVAWKAFAPGRHWKQDMLYRTGTPIFTWLEAAEDHEGLFNVIGRDFYVLLPCYSRAFPGLVCLPCYSRAFPGCFHAQDAFMLKMLSCSRCFHAQDAFMLKMLSCSRCFHAQDAFMLKMLSCSRCFHAQDAFMLSSAPFPLPPMPAACTCPGS